MRLRPEQNLLVIATMLIVLLFGSCLNIYN